ncbi:MAG: hypothetical protein KAS32_01665 [Candidatus Peribacteraceae bacterium]|nr:hypothetical protein [Candidatus Peribacteraceae bacterium]
MRLSNSTRNIEAGDVIIASEPVSNGPGIGLEKSMNWQHHPIRVVDVAEHHILLGYHNHPCNQTAILTTAEFDTGKFIEYPFKEEG